MSFLFFYFEQLIDTNKINHKFYGVTQGLWSVCVYLEFFMMISPFFLETNSPCNKCPNAPNNHVGAVEEPMSTSCEMLSLHSRRCAGHCFKRHIKKTVRTIWSVESAPNIGGNFVLKGNVGFNPWKLISSYLNCMNSWGNQGWEFYRTIVLRYLK